MFYVTGLLSVSIGRFLQRSHTKSQAVASQAGLKQNKFAVVGSVYKGPGKRGHIVVDTLLPMMFLGLRKLRNICCGHKMFLNKIRNIFVSRTQNLCPQQMLRAWANVENVANVANVATMCPRLLGP